MVPLFDLHANPIVPPYLPLYYTAMNPIRPSICTALIRMLFLIYTALIRMLFLICTALDPINQAMRILLDYHLLAAPTAQSAPAPLPLPLALPAGPGPGTLPPLGTAAGTAGGPKKGASSSLKPLGTKLLERSWKVADWAQERCMLRPTVLDLRCPVGSSPDVRLLLALLGPDGDLTGQVRGWPAWKQENAPRPRASRHAN